MSLLGATSVSFRKGSKHLVNDVSLALEAGELLGLIGPNGAGKSTLLSLLAGLESCDSGEVLLGQRKLKNVALAELSRELAWVGQSGPIHWPLSVERLVTLGRRPHLGAWQSLGDADEAAVEAALLATDCHALRQQDATTLSGGERTRVLLARALAGEPKILLADEPVAALDLGHQLQTMQVLKNFASSGRGCLVVLHDLSLAARFCDRLCLMHQGSMVAMGQPAEVLDEKNLQDVYAVRVNSGFDEVPWIVPVSQISAKSN